MEQFNSRKEQRNILQKLSNHGEMTVDEIYRELVEEDASSFSYYSDENTEERRLITRLLYFLRNRNDAVRNDGKKWSLSPTGDEFHEFLNEGMPPFDTDKEHENILRAIESDSQPKLGEIHERLVDRNQSVFRSLPTYGWNEERHILIALRDTLRENKGLITNRIGSSDQTWSLTEQGKQELE